MVIEIKFLKLGFWFLLFLAWFHQTEAKNCKTGCDLALGSFYIAPKVNLTYISTLFSTQISQIMQSNPNITSQDVIISGSTIRIPFSCDCIDGGDYLGHMFSYVVQKGDTYSKVATEVYENLTTADWLQSVNSYPADNIPVTSEMNVSVNCSCGDRGVSSDYGLFLTYPLVAGDSLSSLAGTFNVTSTLLRQYNPSSDFSAGEGLVFIPVKDANGSYHPLQSSSSGISVGAIAGIVIAVVVISALLTAVFLYVRASRKKKMMEVALLQSPFEDPSIQHAQGSLGGSEKTGESVALGSVPSGLTGITVDKSVEFTYEELAKATDDFNMANKIGEGGFGAVYYAELRGEKAAIKKMDMQATREFLAELKVLTRVHHLNLVRLIGFCTEGSLFLVYEFIENGNLGQHLHGSGREPLPWSTRVQIALDSARGLEYIHEHTVPVYIHRDIKSANILIDKNYRGKVADFGLTKLTEVGSMSLPTRLVGTFGYMPPEYAQYGDVSPKVDVYAFGVVLYELISAKEAIVKQDGSVAESRGLVALFESVLSQPDPRESLPKVVDPRLSDNYPLDSVYKIAQLARACTQENPQLRPSMRSIVVALMTLSSSTEDWDVGSFYENQALVNLMSGR